ncbi:MAG: hypothetical protein IJI78_00840 [Oscillospiraceae bacterium]|nr:hypothetical protein [Oscillospiraceae bacterium]
MNEQFLEMLKKEYDVTESNIGNDANLSKSGMKFNIRSFEVKGLGHLCLMSMKAMLGLMKMETAVLSAETKDVPLFNIDSISAMGNKTQLVEFYDNQIAPLSEEAAACYMKIKESGPELESYVSGEHWYDPILYPFSYAKKKKGNTEVFDDICRKYIAEYLEQLKTAPDCDPAEKKEKTAAFAQGLLDHGGPAVDQFRKLFGEDAAKRIILGHMYGVLKKTKVVKVKF